MFPHLHLRRFVLDEAPQTTQNQFIIEKPVLSLVGDFTFTFTLGVIPDPNYVLIVSNHATVMYVAQDKQFS